MNSNPLGLKIEAVKALYERVFSYTVGIVNLNMEFVGKKGKDEYHSEGVGSGTAVLIKGRRFILTAKHLLEGATPEQLAYFPRQCSSIVWDGTPQQAPFVVRSKLASTAIYRCEWEDLALIELSEDVPENCYIEFCSVTDYLACPELTQHVMLIGFPTDNSIEVSKRRTGARRGEIMMASVPTGFIGLILNPQNRFLSGFDSASHLLVEFEPAVDGRKPHGYSGSGVWYQRPDLRSTENTDRVWAPEPFFAGVETHGYTKSGIVRAIRAELVKRFIDETLA